MDNSILKIKTEFENLGFYFVDEHAAIGRVHSGNNQVYIDVKITIKEFPVRKPEIVLINYCGREDLFKVIPKGWRHIDELILSTDVKCSEFHICCLHNWEAKKKYNATFIYKRILKWLNSNVKEDWDPLEDLTSWRILPNFSNFRIYLNEQYLEELKSNKEFTIFESNFYHEPYNLLNGKKISKKREGSSYEFCDIDITNSSISYFPEVAEGYFNRIRELKLHNNFVKSKFFVLKLPGHYRFKSMYQLMQTIRLNFRELTSIPQTYKNIPLLILFKGDKGRTEVVSFITNRSFISGNDNYAVKVLKVETLIQRPISIKPSVGILGVGSLGSQVLKLLVYKETEKIYISDFDIISAENIDHHELGPGFLGELKAKRLQEYFKYIHGKVNIWSVGYDDEKVAELSDIIIVTVGSSYSFDQLAFNKLRHIRKPIIWAWLSPNNILQEIVITSESTGCLNCYYHYINTSDEIGQLHEHAKKELQMNPSNELDICGNPHVISQWERTVFLATQITSLISYYSKHGNFKFDYVNYYWGMNDLIPTPLFGFLEKHHKCFCTGGG